MTEGASLIGASASVIVLTTLLVAGLSHVAAPHRLVKALESQGVAVGATYVGLSAMAAEVTIGGVGWWAILSRRDEILSVTLLTAILLLMAYAGWTAVVMRRKAGAECGCPGRPISLTVWIPARAAVLAGLGLLGWSLYPFVSSAGRIELLTLAFAGVGAVTIGPVLWALPSAMAIPDDPLDVSRMRQV